MNESNASLPQKPDFSLSPVHKLSDLSGYFHCDSQFEQIGASDALMAEASNNVAEGLDLACKVDEDVEFGALIRYAVFSENEQLWVFGMRTNQPEASPEANFFGLRFPTTGSIKDKMSELSELI